ncbi:RagB/SusD family nutrient uptake outer membrane protein [Chitinophaga sancti]|uniref:RagB/SusD family nutrient uptake outer membrane protein n=1 Tax=Chitinophaga sancti TaxID=1004 RepID=A0A1K1SHD3_9BACT|nr:RagB/SusD family nutrient uptake outer membrane protein [Chitinophaga sancti]WQD61833.1 RagB/SusD family nutrient uptake outer membrane protein [Chitinophaga sancti]WQG92598.1 RagB/SusD family nutrient uptake outer membrane protein [Chitinophaga sancti]SFW83785.1 SusD family protein [Chitinophaga sancti]
MKNFTRVSLISLGLLTMSSCSKYLDQSPDSTWTELNTPQKVSQLLGTAYPQANYIVFAEAMSDNVTDKGAGVIERTNEDPYFFNDVNDIKEDSPEWYWTACYKAIAACNNALKACENAPDSSRYRAQKGEALVARAYAHFMLVNFFSKFYNAATAATDPGIPYVIEPETVVFEQYNRGTVAEVYDKIEKDLLAGIPLINDEKYEVPHYHFNKSAAHAFATRFYLFKKDYAKVVEFANKTFPNNDLASYMRPWNTTYRTMTPSMLWETYARATEKCNLLLVETQSTYGRNLARYRFGLDNNIETSVLSKNVAGGNYSYPIYYYGTRDYFVPKLTEYFVKASVNATIGDPYVMVPLFTTEEVLFNRAEANLYLGNTADVLSDLNLFASKRIVNYDAGRHAVSVAKAQTFYNTSNSNNALLNTILDFKRAEFLQEGHRWFDLQRYGVTITHYDIYGNKTTVAADDNRRVLQLPLSAQTAGLALNPR